MINFLQTCLISFGISGVTSELIMAPLFHQKLLSKPAIIWLTTCTAAFLAGTFIL